MHSPNTIHDLFFPKHQIRGPKAEILGANKLCPFVLHQYLINFDGSITVNSVWRIWFRKWPLNVISSLFLPHQPFLILALLSVYFLGQFIPRKILFSPSHCFFLVLGREGRDLIPTAYDLLIDYCYKNWSNGHHSWTWQLTSSGDAWVREGQEAKSITLGSPTQNMRIEGLVVCSHKEVKCLAINSRDLPFYQKS